MPGLCRVLCARPAAVRPLPRLFRHDQAPAGWSARPAARLARAGIIIIMISPRMRASFEAGARPAMLHPCPILPVFETAKPAVKRN